MTPPVANKILQIAKLARLHAPTGYLLSFFPASFGVLLDTSLLQSYSLMMLLFVGSIITRGAGCIINDIFDQDFDQQVERTKIRPLASGKITTKDAVIALVIMLICSLGILLSLTKTAIIVGIIAFFMIVIYPLMKRITNLPQLFLGLTFNAGVLIGYAAVHDRISLPAALVYLACCLWTLGYDTIYGFMDIADDKKIDIKSTSRLIEKQNYRLLIASVYLGFITLFTGAIYLQTGSLNASNAAGIITATAILLWQTVTMDITSPQSGLVRFKSNSFVGLALMLSIAGV